MAVAGTHVKWRVANYTFIFMSEIGQPLSERNMRADSDADALEIARLFDYASAVNVLQGDREVGMVLPARKAGKRKPPSATAQ